jgi:hypothetical protein
MRQPIRSYPKGAVIHDWRRAGKMRAPAVKPVWRFGAPPHNEFTWNFGTPIKSDRAKRSIFNTSFRRSSCFLHGWAKGGFAHVAPMGTSGLASMDTRGDSCLLQRYQSGLFAVGVALLKNQEGGGRRRSGHPFSVRMEMRPHSGAALTIHQY